MDFILIHGRHHFCIWFLQQNWDSTEQESYAGFLWSKTSRSDVLYIIVWESFSAYHTKDWLHWRYHSFFLGPTSLAFVHNCELFVACLTFSLFLVECAKNQNIRWRSYYCRKNHDSEPFGSDDVTRVPYLTTESGSVSNSAGSVSSPGVC